MKMTIVSMTCALAMVTGIGVASAQAPVAAASSTASRPDGFSVGIGAGWTLPSDVDSINTFGVRFRLPSGLTLEPSVELGTTQTSMEMGGFDSDSSTAALVLSTIARIPLMSRGKVDLLAIGGGILDYFNFNPDGPDNSSSDTIFALVWGVGVEYWVNEHWSFSFTATNPLFSLVKSRDENVGVDDDTTSTMSIGAIFDPGVRGMIHLYY